MSDSLLQRVGAILGARGSTTPLTADVTGATRVTQAHGRYAEAVRSGNVYTLQTKSATVTATTDISPLPATTGRALIGLFNPLASGKRAELLKVGFSTVSGTPGGPFYLDVIPSASITLTPGTAATNNKSLSATGSAMLGISAAVPGNTVVGRMLRPIGGPAASAVGAGLYGQDEDLAGSIIVPEGGLLVVTAHATGTSHVVSLYLTWEEVDAL